MAEKSIEDALAHFRTWLRFHGSRTATIDAHMQRLRQFVAQTNVRVVTDITATLVADWLASQMDAHEQYQSHPYRRPVARPLSPQTIQARLKSLRYFLRVCVQSGLLPRDPLQQLPAFGRRLPKSGKQMELETAVTILHHAQSQAADGAPLAVRDLAVFALLLDTGVRVGELCSIRIEDVNLSSQTAHVRGKTGERLVSFSQATAAAVADWLAAHPNPTGEWLFVGLGSRSRGRRLSENAVRITLKRLAAGAGVSGPVNPHSIRHLVGQTWVDRANPRLAQEKLGHKDLKTTLGFYYRPDQERLAEYTERFSLLSDDR